MQKTKDVKPAAKRRSKVDWEAVERDYRTTHMTTRELSDKYGVSHTAINKHVRKHGYERDLTGFVRAATKAKLLKEAVRDEVLQEQVQSLRHSNSEAMVLAHAAAQANVDIVLRHRKNLARLRGLQESLMAALEEAMEDASMPRMRSAMVSDLTRLTEIDARIRAGERQAFGIDEEAKEQANSAEDLLKRLAEGEL